MRECSESLTGRHRWVGADVAAGVYRPECADCHEDGEIGGDLDEPKVCKPSRRSSGSRPSR